MPGGRARVSPYHGVEKSKWRSVTSRLIDEHPLGAVLIVESVLQSWSDLFESSFGSNGFRLGKDLFPTPQVLGNLLHELIPLHLKAADPRWRQARTKKEKDLVYESDPRFSIELKTSSSK